MRTVNYENLYFHVITLCSLDVTVNFFWANDFQPPRKKTARTPMVVSGQKSAFSPMQENLCVGSTTFRIVTTFSVSMQVFWEIEQRTSDVGAKIDVFFVCHAWSACAWAT